MHWTSGAGMLPKQLLKSSTNCRKDMGSLPVTCLTASEMNACMFILCSRLTSRRALMNHSVKPIFCMYPRAISSVIGSYSTRLWSVSVKISATSCPDRGLGPVTKYLLFSPIGFVSSAAATAAHQPYREFASPWNTDQRGGLCFPMIQIIANGASIRMSGAMPFIIAVKITDMSLINTPLADARI